MFVRLLTSEPSIGTVPVSYRVHDVVPMDCNGRCQMRLAQMQPRAKESSARKVASKVVEDLRNVCDTRQTDTGLQLEEILQ